MVQRHQLAIVGIGSSLAGDDAAGLEVFRILREACGDDLRVLLHSLEGDLFEIADLLPCAAKFIFVDAIAGDPPGQIVHGYELPRASAPSGFDCSIQSDGLCIRVSYYYPAGWTRKERTWHRSASAF